MVRRTGVVAAAAAAVAAAVTIAALTAGSAAQTIAETASGNPELSLLVRALEDANLVSVVANASAILTVFAPNDAAFVSLAQTLGYAGDDKNGAYEAIVADLTRRGNGNPIPTLTNILQYHVAAGEVRAADLVAAGGYKPLVGPNVRLNNDRVTLGDAAPAVDDAALLQTDINATNGVVHIISGVLLPIAIVPAPPTIAVLAASDPELSLLVRALNATNLIGVVANPSANLTVFAPNDAAFVSLAQTLGYAGDDKNGAYEAIVADLTRRGNGNPIPTLTNILQYHVAAGEVRAADLVAAGGYKPLLGANVTLSEDGATLMDASPAVADPKLVATDVNATNGVVHVIDGVLLPIAIVPVEPTIALLAVRDPELSLLARALDDANLTSVVANASATLTVFAPNDAAFVSLAQTLGYAGDDKNGAYEAIVADLTRRGNGNPIPTLTNILQYHVAAGEVRAADLVATGGYTSLLGANVTLSEDGATLMDASPAVADPKLVATDVNATNGVVHVIDGVLLPIAVDVVTPTPTAAADDDESVCFPADATVTLASGVAVRMDALAVGDSVAVGGGRFSHVFAFTHADAAAVSTFVVLTVAAPADTCAAHARDLRMTRGHYLSVNGRLAAASTVAVGDRLVRADGSEAVVTRVATATGTGLYNPQTVDGNILVDGLVTSTYTTAVEPRVAHAALAPLRALYAVGGGWVGGCLTESSRLAGLLPRGPLVV